MNVRNYNPALMEKILEDSPNSFQRKITSTPNEPYDVDPSADEIIMVVDLGDGRKKNIKIAPSDDPTTLSKKFCF
jgi:hypothetical protein